MEKMMKEKTISHFTHPQPGHVLSLVNDHQPTDFKCDLCKIPSKNNLRFKCTICPDFNLDSVCAHCDQVTNTFMHPDHILVFNLKPEVATILCSVCNQDIKGGHYSCCDFHAHPVCTKFPEIITAGTSPAHEDHQLKGIFSSVPTTCHVCHYDCTGLRYQCTEGCDVDFHPSCLAGFCKIPSKNNLRFKCTICPDFNLDHVCASCDQVTNTFMHPDHILVFNLKPEVATILCSVCNQDIKGGHYSCCDFHVHPVCTKFPEIIRAGMSSAHADHALKGIFSSDLTTCHVCRTDCAGLRYRCEEEGCDFDFHPPCLTGFGDGDVSGNTRGFPYWFQRFQGVMLGLDIWDLVNMLQGFLF